MAEASTGLPNLCYAKGQLTAFSLAAAVADAALEVGRIKLISGFLHNFLLPHLAIVDATRFRVQLGRHSVRRLATFWNESLESTERQICASRMLFG